MELVTITTQRLKELEKREEMYSISHSLHARQKNRVADLERDIAILVMRLHGESRDTHSPEVNELLDAYPLDWAMDLLNQESEADYIAELERGYAKDRI